MSNSPVFLTGFGKCVFIVFPISVMALCIGAFTTCVVLTFNLIKKINED